MSTSFTTTAGSAVGLPVAIRPVQGATYTVEFSRNQGFKTILFSKPITVVGKVANLIMTASEVDNLRDGFYRIRATKSGATNTVDSGRVDFIPTKKQAGAADIAKIVETRAARWSSRSVPGESGLPKLMSNPPTLGTAVAEDFYATPPGMRVVGAILDQDWEGSANGKGRMNTTAFRFGGGPWEQLGLGWPNANFAGPAGEGSLQGEGLNYPYIEFLYYGAGFHYAYKAAGWQRTRVYVDGQMAESLSYADPTPNDGGSHWRSVTFSSPGWRRIKIDFGPVGFFGLRVGNGDAVMATPVLGDTLLVIGDSFAEGTGSDLNRGWPVLFGAMMGFDNVVGMAQGGTGLTTSGGLTIRKNYIGRAVDWPKANATHVLVQFTGNDYPASDPTLAAAVGPLIDALEALPGKPEIWFVGHWANNGGDAVTGGKYRDSIVRPLVEARGHLFISQLEPQGIWTGSGHVGATKGDGSSDVLVGEDGTHPTPAGHEGIARSLFTRFIAALNS